MNRTATKDEWLKHHPNATREEILAFKNGFGAGWKSRANPIMPSDIFKKELVVLPKLAPPILEEARECAIEVIRQADKITFEDAEAIVQLLLSRKRWLIKPNPKLAECYADTRHDFKESTIPKDEEE